MNNKVIYEISNSFHRCYKMTKKNKLVENSKSTKQRFKNKAILAESASTSLTKMINIRVESPRPIGQVKPNRNRNVVHLLIKFEALSRLSQSFMQNLYELTLLSPCTKTLTDKFQHKNKLDSPQSLVVIVVRCLVISELSTCDLCRFASWTASVHCTH